MTDRPIIFSAPMVRALLDGRKTQTRRVLGKARKHAAGLNIFDGTWADAYVLDPGNADWRERCTPYGVGDRLWTRETWRALHRDDCLAPRNIAPDRSKVTYEADPENRNKLWSFGKTRTAIHMPRWASRLTLLVTDVRVQRLQEISEDDAKAEGITDGGCLECGNPEPCGCASPTPSAKDGFFALWLDIHGRWSVLENPWVCAISFTVHHCNIDAMEQPK